MPNKAQPKIPITLDKKRHLLFDLNAMVAFEEQTGINIMSPNAQLRLADNMTPKQLRAFLWSCLLHEDETLTLHDVGKMLNGSNVEDIAARLNAASDVAAPEVEPAGEGESPLA